MSAAFWVMAWVFAVQHPDGAVTERVHAFRNHYSSEAECEAKATAARAGIPLQGVTEDGGDALYSRFVCIPIDPAEPRP